MTLVAARITVQLRMWMHGELAGGNACGVEGSWALVERGQRAVAVAGPLRGLDIGTGGDRGQF